MSETGYQRLEVLSFYDQERAIPPSIKIAVLTTSIFAKSSYEKKKPCIIVHVRETIERKMVKKETVFLHARIPL